MLRKPIILFPSDYSDKSVVDSSFGDEYQAAFSQTNLSVALFDQKVFDEQGIVRVELETDPAVTPITVYRGWMMKPEQYSSFFKQLGDQGVRLINTPEEYANLHLFPNSYEKLKEVTPKTLVFKSDDVSYEKVVEAFDRFIIKDYVKSVKGFDFPVPIESSISREEFATLLERFRYFRGDLFTGGYVFKQFVDYKRYGDTTNEWRCFYLNHRILTYSRNSGQHKTCPYPSWGILTSCSNLGSPYYTIDFAELEDGGWVVIETGDGQVSGLASEENLVLYFQKLSEDLLLKYLADDSEGIEVKRT